MREDRVVKLADEDLATALVEVYVCDHCGAVSQHGQWWVGVSRLGPVAGFSDQLAWDRTFCSTEHATAWLQALTRA